MTNVWLVALLTLTLPADYQPESNVTQAFSMPGPPGTKNERSPRFVSITTANSSERIPGATLHASH